MIETLALPLTSKACVQLGFRTMMGTGAFACCNAQTAWPPTSIVFFPVIKPAKLTPIRSVTSTCRNGVGASVLGGGVKPGTVPGKLILTSSDGVFAVKPGDEYPLRAAY